MFTKSQEHQGLPYLQNLLKQAQKELELSSSPLPFWQDELALQYGCRQLLPIEAFKEQKQALQRSMGQAAVRRFQSSGTSQREQSESLFSQKGLELYQAASVCHFYEILTRFFPEPHLIQGYSLIPKLSEWPHSSLAQMLAWLAEILPVQAVTQVPELSSPQPIWIFGTAFHFIQMIDQGLARSLPEGSLLIETGGTKGRAREIPRPEYLELLGKSFALPAHAIISEYGMCELACQAYDALESPLSHGSNPPQARFRFAPHVRVSVIRADREEAKQGRGSLVVADPLRIDFPWPVRTEDLVALHEDGSFQLLGRVPMSPLKGCSLLAEDLHQAFLAPPAQSPKLREPQPSSLLTRSAAVYAVIEDLRKDKAFWELLEGPEQKSIQSLWLQEDFQLSFSLDRQQWQALCQQYSPKIETQHWLLLGPRTHSYGLIAPLLWGCALGLEIWLRDPLESLAIQSLVQKLKAIGPVWTLPSRWRLGEQALPEAIEAALAFASDETLAELQSLMPQLSWQGFGSLISGLLLHAQDLRLHAQALWRDALSLEQKGCLSLRLVFCIDEKDISAEDWDEFLRASALAHLSLGEEIGLEHARFQAFCAGHRQLSRRSGECLVSLLDFDPKLSLNAYLLPRAYCLTVVRLSEKQLPEFWQWAQRQNSLWLKYTQSAQGLVPAGLPFELLQPGTMNASSQGPQHLGRYYFVPESSQETMGK